jgi:NifB/MoaA-like Fe-S oxidoreductase
MSTPENACRQFDRWIRAIARQFGRWMDTEVTGTITPRREEGEHIEQTEESKREELATHARTLTRWDAITQQREKGLAEDDDAFEAGKDDPGVH